MLQFSNFFAWVKTFCFQLGVWKLSGSGVETTGFPHCFPSWKKNCDFSENLTRELLKFQFRVTKSSAIHFCYVMFLFSSHANVTVVELCYWKLTLILLKHSDSYVEIQTTKVLYRRIDRYRGEIDRRIDRQRGGKDRRIDSLREGRIDVQTV